VTRTKPAAHSSERRVKATPMTPYSVAEVLIARDA
jgi:hypothetical protein